jgi:hypothetical protein
MKEATTTTLICSLALQHSIIRNKSRYASIQETDPDAVTTANGERRSPSFLSGEGSREPLVWWKDCIFPFPGIAFAARKWLSVSGTSASSERAFSHCGVALTAKRATMRGDALMNQILLKNNLKHLNLSMEDIEKSGYLFKRLVAVAVTIWQADNSNLEGCRTATTTLAVDTSIL